MPRFLIPILTCAFLITSQNAMAQTFSQSSVSVIGDGHKVRLVETGRGTSTIIDLDGHRATVHTNTLPGGHTRVIGHGEGGQVHLVNPGEDRTFIFGGCADGLTPRVTHGNAGVSFVTCH